MSASYEPAQADLSLAALFAGWALADEVQRRLATDGFDDLRFADGFVFQHLVAGPVTVGVLAERLGVTQQAASKSAADLARRGYVRPPARPRRRPRAPRGAVPPRATGDRGRPPPPRRSGGRARRPARAAAHRGRATAAARRRRRPRRRAGRTSAAGAGAPVSGRAPADRAARVRDPDLGPRSLEQPREPPVLEDAALGLAVRAVASSRSPRRTRPRGRSRSAGTARPGARARASASGTSPAAGARPSSS